MVQDYHCCLIKPRKEKMQIRVIIIIKKLLKSFLSSLCWQSTFPAEFTECIKNTRNFFFLPSQLAMAFFFFFGN